ncbi:hypothetical protein G9P44_001394 [Scheffersomyces stipitis]|nr:hypothetical protein G9P44_001394 [Scheffersomyces stipitis]
MSQYDSDNGKVIERRVWLNDSERVTKICDLLPSNKGRQSLISSLLSAYGLRERCYGIIGEYRASRQELASYHDENFVDFLLQDRLRLDRTVSCELTHDFQYTGASLASNHDTINDEISISESQRYGLVHDCYIFPFIGEYVRAVGGSSIASAKTLIREASSSIQNVVVNWYGGRHHCTKSRAAGYCYINDVVLAIGVLRKKFRRIFYLDLDLHHGDGVESGYEHSKNVFTCSIHRYDLGFYPGTGRMADSKSKKVNIPTRRGLSDNSLLYIIKNIVVPLIMGFEPEVIIIQAGCDGLGTDTHKEWNLTIKGFSQVLDFLLKEFEPIPFLILGGGGYNHTETAKCWAHATRTILGHNEEWDLIPEHSLLDEYEDDGYQFWTGINSAPMKKKDENDMPYLEEMKSYILNMHR